MHRKFPKAVIEAATARANEDRASPLAKADAEMGAVVSNERGKKNVFLVREGVIDKVMQFAAREGAESEHKEVKIAASVLGAFCITAISTPSTNQGELDACVDSLRRKGIHGMSGVKAIISISTHYAATCCPNVPDSKSNKKPVKSALKDVLNHIAERETRSTVSPDYPYWFARCLIKAADKAAVDGDFTGVYNARKRDVHEAIIDELLKNRSSRHFLAFMLDIDIDTSNVDFKATLEAAMVGFVAGLPNFFDAPAVPPALVAVAAGLVTAPPAETAPLDTSLAPAAALDSLARGINLGAGGINLGAVGIEAGGLGALAHALVPAQPTTVRGAPPSSYDYNTPTGAAGLGFTTPALTTSAGVGGGAMPRTFGSGGFGATAAIELLGTGTPASTGGGAVPVTAETLANLLSMILGQMSLAQKIEELTAELKRIKALPMGLSEKTILLSMQLNTTLNAYQEQLNGNQEQLEGIGDVFVDSFEKIATNLKGITAEIEKGNQETFDSFEKIGTNLKGITAEIEKGNQETAKALRELFSRKAPASTPVPATVSAAGPSGGLAYGGASASNAATPAPRGIKWARPRRPPALCAAILLIGHGSFVRRTFAMRAALGKEKAAGKMHHDD